MLAYVFRIIDDDGKPTGYYGFAFAQNKREMFHVIDYHCDPFRVEVQTIYDGSLCGLMLELPGKVYEEGDGIEDDFVLQEAVVHQTPFVPDGEFSEFSERKWRKPTWKGVY